MNYYTVLIVVLNTIGWTVLRDGSMDICVYMYLWAVYVYLGRGCTADVQYSNSL